MFRIAVGAVTLVLTAILVRHASAQVDSCAGGCPKLPKNTRSVSAEFVTLAAFPGNTLSTTLAKGKTKSILRVDGTMFEVGSHSTALVSREFDLGISVNGL